jgi:hypothetical protein
LIVIATAAATWWMKGNGVAGCDPVPMREG